MRSDYNILWMDDDFENDTSFLRRLVGQVEDHLKEKGYHPNIIKVSNKDDALEMINFNRKIDLFLSDYNIAGDDKFSGFDFLIATRKKYKQEMFLYSNLDDGQLKKHLLEYLAKDSTPITYFSKFLFQSATNTTLLISSIKSLIDLTLLRWDELNALRGLYLSETSQIHYDAKEYISRKIPSDNLCNNFMRNYHTSDKKQKILSVLDGTSKDLSIIESLEFVEVQCILSSDSDFYNKWDEIREIRNGCAHVVQLRDSSGENYIQSLGSSKLKIKESEIDQYRIKLLKFTELYYKNYPNDNGGSGDDEGKSLENYVYQ